MKVRFNLNNEDVWNFNKYAIFNIPKMRNKFWLNIAAIPVLIVGANYLIKLPIMTLTMVAVIAPILGYFYSTFKMKTRITKSIYNNKGVLCEHTVKINEEGIREITSVNDSFHSWKDIKDVKENKEYIFVFIDNIMAYIIPKSAFSSEVQCKEFFKKSLSSMQNSK